jgi:hypothetical protein
MCIWRYRDTIRIRDTAAPRWSRPTTSHAWATTCWPGSAASRASHTNRSQDRRAHAQVAPERRAADRVLLVHGRAHRLRADLRSAAAGRRAASDPDRRVDPDRYGATRRIADRLSRFRDTAGHVSCEAAGLGWRLMLETNRLPRPFGRGG